MGLKKNKNPDSLGDIVNSVNEDDFLKTTVDKNTLSINEKFNNFKSSSKKIKENRFEWALNFNLPILATITLSFFGGGLVSYVFNEQAKSERVQVESHVFSLDKSLEKIEKNALTLKNKPADSIESLEKERKNVNQIIEILKNGGQLEADTSIVTKPLLGKPLDTLTEIETSWRNAEKILNAILSQKEGIVRSKEIVAKINKNSNEVMKQVSNLQKILQNKSADNIKFASELSISVYKILNEIASADIKVLSDADKELLNAALVNVNETLKTIKDLYKKDSPELAQMVSDFERVFSRNVNKSGLVDNISIINAVTIQADLLESNSAKSKENVPILREEINGSSFSLIAGLQYQTIALISALLGTVFLALIAISLYARWVKSLKLANMFKKNQSNEKVLVELLALIQPLEEGDFSKEIVLEDKFLKRIAVAMDTTRQRFGKIVKQMKSSSSNILEVAGTTEISSQELASLSKKQFEKVQEAINAINEITNSIDEVAQSAYAAQEESTKSAAESEKGKLLVDESREKMIEIRNTIQESSKKIKKLGESAQSINEVTSLIKDITKQINILALNAAIQAASSGESGREFTVVAQEVQRLADDSENATKKIEELINDIQTDTAAAIASMEKTTQEVVLGAQLTEQAGEALNHINTLSKNTAEQIMAASTKLEEKSSEMAGVTVEMQGLQKVSKNAEQALDVTTTQVEALKKVSEQLEEAFKQYKV